MSEYTDYMIYQPAAETLPQLQAEVAQQVGASVIVLSERDYMLDEAEAAALLAKPGRKWLAILTETELSDMPVQTAASVFVLEDFASWQLQVKCQGKIDSFRFGGPDGYATGWFKANFGDGTLTTDIPDKTLARLSTCFNSPVDVLRKNLGFDMPWTFLESLGAPAVQMMDRGVSLSAVEDKLKSGQVLFHWDALEDDW